MAIDSHMHLNSKVLKDKDREIKRINACDYLTKVINIGLDIETSKEIIEISNRENKFYSSVGIHPLYIDGQNINELIPLIENPKVVAIGEIGLDTKSPNYEEQLEYLIRQIEIANLYQLPVIIHSNNSNEQILKVFREVIKPEYGCVFHCFQPEIDKLEDIISYSYYISIAGRITYETAKRSIEVASTIPENRFLVETDAPYIAPVPYKKETNHSDYLKYVIQRISEVRNTSFENVENITEKNTLRLFKKLK